MNKEERLKEDGYEGVEPVLFYGPSGPNGEGSNFSEHDIWLPNPFNGLMSHYDSGEHRFQAMKGIRQRDHDYVNMAPDSRQAKKRGREIKLREGWGNDYGDLCWYVMAELILAKTSQHISIRKWLRTTIDHPIYEDSPVDDIWGWRYEESYTGKNLLGRCWMAAREIYA